MNKFNLFLTSIISLPKSLYFNFRILPFKIAIKMPILINYKTKIKIKNKSKLIIDNCNKAFNIKIGFGYNYMVDSKKTNYLVLDNSTIIFKGKCTIGSGFSIRVENSLVVIGINFYSQQNFILWSTSGISIGDDVLVGWDVMIRDHDGHNIITDGVMKPSKNKISIGNHVWLCSCSNIFKGVIIRDDCVIGYRSIVTKKFDNSNCLIVGSPAKIVRDNINWKR